MSCVIGDCALPEAVMVLIDTSVWVDYLRGLAPPWMAKIVNTMLDEHEAALTPVIRLELLRGASPEESRLLQEVLGGLHELAFEASHWRQADRLLIALRANGLTPSLADLLIATSALAYRVPLYHQDKIFDAMARYAGLELYRPSTGMAR